jgi:hypothetical protein
MEGHHAPTRYDREVFTGKVVRLDNAEFIACTFDDCTLVYGGSGYVALRNLCDIKSNCRFKLDGAAGNTVKFMTVLYPLAPALIEATIDNIRGGSNPMAPSN